MEGQATASATLDAIRTGGQTAILNIHRKLAQVKVQLEEGKFTESHQTMSQALGLMSPLAAAEQVLGYMGKGVIVQAADIQVGMNIVTYGKVKEISDGECRECGKVHRLAEMDDGMMMALHDGNEFVVDKYDDV